MRSARTALVLALIACSIPLRAWASQADTFYRDVKAGQYARAVTEGRAYLASHPQNDAFALDLAYAYLKLGEREAARNVLLARGAYFEKHPDAATIWLELSYQDSTAKEYRQAIADADRALRYRPDDAAAWKQRDAAASALTPPPPDDSVLFYQAVAANRYSDALPLGVRYLASHPANGAFAVDLAYAYLQVKDLPAATELANRYAGFISSDKNAAKLLAALFYAELASGATDRAIFYGEKYRALRPDDEPFAMDLTYAQLKAGNLAAARTILAAHESYLRTHPDAAKVWLDLGYRDADAKEYSQAIADVDVYLSIHPGDSSALAQRTVYVNDLRGGPRETLYGYTYYDSRFHDTFFGADQSYVLSQGRGPQLYFAAHLSEDLRSGAPGSPQIYNDDALITDLGIRQSITPNLSAFIEGGAGIGLRGQGTISDVRYGFLYSQQWGKALNGTTTINASAVLYSRYAGNAIMYYNVLHAFPGRSLRPLIGLNGGLDSHSVFGNNYLEGLYGVETGTSALTFRVVGVEGTYLTRGTVPTQPAYSGVRASIIFGFSN